MEKPINKDAKIKRLEREIKKLKLENEKLKEIHMCDQSYAIYLRRQVEFLTDALNEEIEYG